MNISRQSMARINSVKTLPRLSLDFVDISHTVYPIAAPKFEREVRAETSGRVVIRGKQMPMTLGDMKCQQPPLS
ncbi:hypothetical protein CBM2586_B130010 [Cupriavidus phytorum]|uniref:Uncharacterized protein n=1 Tax=Cupriavidus taiwanensis TaxID=164546 RepID=A0A975XHY2_9BURK|nr:hypothetical protein CBM2586_B130010 [Cupriavidus taiwanensis]